MPVGHKSLHVAHETFHQEAPVVAHVVPAVQEVTHMDDLVEKIGQLALRYIAFENAQREDQLRLEHLGPELCRSRCLHIPGRVVARCKEDF